MGSSPKGRHRGLTWFMPEELELIKEEDAMSIDVSKIKAGDWVSITVGYEGQPETHATLSGIVYIYGGETLRIGTDYLRIANGEPGLAVQSIDEHKPARQVGDLKISPDGLPVVYVGKCVPVDNNTWIAPRWTSGYVDSFSDDEVAGWPDAEAVKK